MPQQVRRLAILAHTIVLLGLLGIPVWAQTEQAGITGTVRDHQGGTIRDAFVELKHAETMLVRTTRTSEFGTFFIGALAIGNYSLFISHPGFAGEEPSRERCLTTEIREATFKPSLTRM